MTAGRFAGLVGQGVVSSLFSSAESAEWAKYDEAVGELAVLAGVDLEAALEVTNRLAAETTYSRDAILDELRRAIVEFGHSLKLAAQVTQMAFDAGAAVWQLSRILAAFAPDAFGA